MCTETLPTYELCKVINRVLLDIHLNFRTFIYFITTQKIRPWKSSILKIHGKLSMETLK